MVSEVDIFMNKIKGNGILESQTHDILNSQQPLHDFVVGVKNRIFEKRQFQFTYEAVLLFNGEVKRCHK